MNRKLSFAVSAGFASLALVAMGCASKPAATAQPAVTNVPPPSAPAAYPVAAVQTTELPAPQPIDTAAPMLAADTSGMTSSNIGGSKYTVKAGDTLFHIAATHYGSGGQWKKIAAANPGVNPSKLHVGQTITLP